MGTRHLICVFIDGEYKVAQYGQWDGYPSGQGVRVLEFLRCCDFDVVCNRVRETRFLTADELESLDGTDWQKTHPQLSRDVGADVLNLIMAGKTDLKNSLDFAGDSLFCEYCYVIDFDASRFEVYEGFNKEPVLQGRFVSGNPMFGEPTPSHDGRQYEPVKLVKQWSLSELPTKDEFIAAFETEEEPA